MSNGDSLDDFVFPPFIPTASTRPAQSPPPPPTQDATPAPEPSSAADAWLTESLADAASAQPESAAADEVEDLPWLEVPTPREEPAAVAAPVDDAFPDWMAWDQRDESAAEADARDAVAPVAGLEELLTMDDLNSPPPTVQWTDVEPEPSAAPVTDFAFDEEPSAAPPSFAEPFPDFAFDEAPAAAAPVSSAEEPWAVDTADSVDPVDTPPAVAEAFPTWDEAPAAEGASADSVDEAAAPAVAESASAAEPPPFVADEEAVMAAEPQPSAADDAAPAPTAAAEAEAMAAPASAGSPFEDVAGRLEAIARTLRERPDELLAGASSDPLALLVTGYVMGYTARGR
jgi:hypothetical protein